jgi:DNA integrity scanning protein DisA with diadenylate cyclase activity
VSLVPLPQPAAATPPPAAAPGPVRALAHLLQLAADAAERYHAAALLILPEEPLDWVLVRESCGEARVLVAIDQRKLAGAIEDAGLTPLEVDPTDAAIAERISLALIQAVADGLVRSGNRVVVVYAGFQPEVLDSLTVIRLGEHLEKLSSRDLRELETSVPFETLKPVVDIAVEIGREGREGNPVGTLIVVGDTRAVRARTRTLAFDPFRGYRRKERNIRDPRVREAIKEIAQLDGAFVVSRDGTVEAACQYIDAPITGLTLTKGLGTRHWAAAAITKVTDALAVVVSQSTGTVRLFQGGEVILRLAPMRHVRAMKWRDEETEAHALRKERDRDDEDD